MIAVLTENFAGKWPFWLSPRQAMVVPVGPSLNQYAQEIRDSLKTNGYCADVDTDDGNSFNKKVRNAQLAQYNFIFGKYVKCYGSIEIEYIQFSICHNHISFLNKLHSNASFQLWAK